MVLILICFPTCIISLFLFIAVNSISLCEYTVILFYIYLLIDICVICSFGLLRIKLLCFCVPVFSLNKWQLVQELLLLTANTYFSWHASAKQFSKIIVPFNASMSSVLISSSWPCTFIISYVFYKYLWYRFYKVIFLFERVSAYVFARFFSIRFIYIFSILFLMDECIHISLLSHCQHVINFCLSDRYKMKF